MSKRLVAVVSILLICLCAGPLRAADDYVLGSDSQPKEGVPRGKVTQYHWASKVFDGTERDYWVYVPAQYDGKTPACVMVFQDGKGYVDLNGQFHVPTVFDNLIAAGQMPVTVGIFINPGSFPKTEESAEPSSAKRPKQNGGSNRSFEYDTLSDQYAKFLLQEILPEVGKTVKLTEDPNGRAICGISSGGICAFTVAWEHPEAFRKVVAHVGSFDDIRGGHNYPFMIRKAPPKPIRVFLQDGTNDLDNDYGNWFLGTQQMEKALLYANKKADAADAKAGSSAGEARYDVKFVAGDGAHNGKHGGSILPDTLRWLWRDYKPVGEEKH